MSQYGRHGIQGFVLALLGFGLVFPCYLLTLPSNIHWKYITVFKNWDSWLRVCLEFHCDFGLSNHVGAVRLWGVLNLDWMHFALWNGHEPVEIRSRLWFACKMSQQVDIFKHLVSRWWYCSGRWWIYKRWQLGRGNESLGKALRFLAKLCFLVPWGVSEQPPYASTVMMHPVPSLPGHDELYTFEPKILWAK